MNNITISPRVSIKLFQKVAKERNITEWQIHNCSICDFGCKYLINFSKIETFQVRYNSGCDCTNEEYSIEESSWIHIASHYNRQRNLKVIHNYDEFWGFVPYSIRTLLKVTKDEYYTK